MIVAIAVVMIERNANASINCARSGRSRKRDANVMDASRWENRESGVFAGDIARQRAQPSYDGAASSSVRSTPSWCRAIILTAVSSEATEPSWKYGAVRATFLRLGTLNTMSSAGLWVIFATAMIGLIRPGYENPYFFEHRAADIGTGVADHAAQVGK